MTLAEAAMLAGLVKSPSRLAPNRNPEGAEKRAQTVLAAMADAQFITEAQAQASIGHPSYNVKPAGAGTVNYVADWIGEVLDDLVGQIDQDIVVETSIDPKLQSIAEAAVIDELAAKSVKFNVSQGALVAMTPDGAVRAMVGGRNYSESQYNRAVTAKRQPGSAFKPFVYLTAIEAGMTPDTIRQDAPINVKGWKPENFERRISRRGDADAGAGEFAQYGRGARLAWKSALPTSCAPRTGSAFRRSSRPMPRSRSAPRKSRSPNWSAPMCRSPMAARASRRMSC